MTSTPFCPSETSMKNTNLSAPIVRLIERFQAWHQTASDDRTGLSSGERGALLNELLGLLEEHPRGARSADPWRLFAGLFSQRAATATEERARRERQVLRAYEQLCECELPFHVSSVLLRHYSVIKRASHVADDDRLNPPTPARGTAIPRMSLAAMPVRVAAR